MMKQPLHRAYDALGRDSGFALGSVYSVQYVCDTYGRFSSLSALASLRETNTFTYAYLPNTDLISGMTASSGFLWTRAYESARSIITSVENRYGQTVISRYDYANDELGRRTSRADSGLAFAAQPTYGDSATVEMPAYNAYSYNTRSEVTGAARRWGTPDASGDLVLGQQYAYAFDAIGNRLTAAEGDTDRTASYTANELNQYTQRTVPDEKDLIGTAPTNVAVTVNAVAVTRQNAYWHHALEVDNATDAAYPQVAITAVYNPPGTNDPDVVTSQTGRVFVAKTPEPFQYDNDGNLTQDGRFTYAWDAENRLIAVTTRDDLPTSVPRIRVAHLYDHQSRRIASATAVWTNDAWQAAASRAFLYDGWNVIVETINNQPSTTNYYVWGLDLSGSIQGAGGIGGLLATSLDGTIALYCHDANGNVGQLVSPGGDLLAHYEYSPFGETIAASGPLAEVNPFRFSTKWFEKDTGLGCWVYRWYSSVMGRWLSLDPLYGQAHSAPDATWTTDYGPNDHNLYGCGNSTINSIDAYGLSATLHWRSYYLVGCNPKAPLTSHGKQENGTRRMTEGSSAVAYEHTCNATWFGRNVITTDGICNTPQADINGGNEWDMTQARIQAMNLTCCVKWHFKCHVVYSGVGRGGDSGNFGMFIYSRPGYAESRAFFQKGRRSHPVEAWYNAFFIDEFDYEVPSEYTDIFILKPYIHAGKRGSEAVISEQASISCSATCID
jgi:RHS repeat-associated protein